MPFRGQKCAKLRLNLGLRGMCSSENGTYIMSLNKPGPKCPMVAVSSQMLFTPWGDMAVGIELQPETSIRRLDIPGILFYQMKSTGCTIDCF